MACDRADHRPILLSLQHGLEFFHFLVNIQNLGVNSYKRRVWLKTKKDQDKSTSTGAHNNQLEWQLPLLETEVNSPACQHLQLTFCICLHCITLAPLGI